MRKRTILKVLFALAVMGVGTPVPRVAAEEEEVHPGGGRFVRWKNDDGTLNCYPDCQLYKPCC